ncbi:MAG: HU family DNA-binding protein [Alphaproteobacteria bacterium]|nr:HU family DNA-binding protein [Alphaproteobacteria bacterium]
MATITRNDLASNLRDKFGLTATDAYKMIDIIFQEIGDALTNGEDVKLSGFGTFKILTKPARIGRNPKTGVPAVISARRVAAFRPSAEFRTRVGNK